MTEHTPDVFETYRTARDIRILQSLSEKAIPSIISMSNEDSDDEARHDLEQNHAIDFDEEYKTMFGNIDAFCLMVMSDTSFTLFRDDSLLRTVTTLECFADGTVIKIVSEKHTGRNDLHVETNDEVSVYDRQIANQAYERLVEINKEMLANSNN